MYNNNYMIDNLTRQKEKIEDMIRSYSQPQPVNNFINTNQTSNENMYELKVLNDSDEVENILVNTNTIFLGIDRLQIKKIDGTIEKYNITKTYPIDKKDKKINELEEEIKKLKEMINNEPTEHNITNGECNKSDGITNVNAQSKSKTNGKSISKQE